MSTEEREKLKESAKEYVKQLYLAHRDDDVEAWQRLIDIIWIYIDSQIDMHCKDHHDGR